MVLSLHVHWMMAMLQKIHNKVVVKCWIVEVSYYAGFAIHQ